MRIKKKVIMLTPPQILLYVFIIAISIGTVMLKIPAATIEPISWLDALFTATSAMTVTGLTAVDTEFTFTTFGLVIIMILIQLGGLGIMSFAVLIFMMLGRKIGFSQRLVIQQALNQPTIGGVVLLVKRLFIFSALIEGIAFVFLSIRWVPEFGWKEGLFASLFHAVSAFNNAGFSVWSDNLIGYVTDPVVNIVISFLFITGGLGFTVLADIYHTKEFRRLSLHTKIMITSTISINIVMFLFVFLLEYKNPLTLGPLSFMGKIIAAYFQAVTPRTAGFNTINYGDVDDSTAFMTIILMFIGAGSASTGGGIKLTTFIAMILSVVTFLKGRDEVVFFRRRIRDTIIVRCLAITVLSCTFVLVATILLGMVEEARFLIILFEVISAFGTVGLTMGLTFELSTIGKWIIIVVMFIGKIGPLTLAFSLTGGRKSHIRYPKEDILTG